MKTQVVVRLGDAYVSYAQGKLEFGEFWDDAHCDDVIDDLLKIIQQLKVRKFKNAQAGHKSQAKKPEKPQNN
jgi:hypothetical protein